MQTSRRLPLSSRAQRQAVSSAVVRLAAQRRHALRSSKFRGKVCDQPDAPSQLALHLSAGCDSRSQVAGIATVSLGTPPAILATCPWFCRLHTQRKLHRARAGSAQEVAQAIYSHDRQRHCIKCALVAIINGLCLAAEVPDGCRSGLRAGGRGDTHCSRWLSNAGYHRWAYVGLVAGCPCHPCWPSSCLSIGGRGRFRDYKTMLRRTGLQKG